MNIILGINSVLAIFTLFLSAAAVVCWGCYALLKSIARTLRPLLKDEEDAAPSRPKPRLAKPATKRR